MAIFNLGVIFLGSAPVEEAIHRQMMTKHIIFERLEELLLFWLCVCFLSIWNAFLEVVARPFIFHQQRQFLPNVRFFDVPCQT